MKEHQENAAQTVKNTVQTAKNVVQAAENAAHTTETKEAGWHHEDLALKTAAQYFGEELLPLLGIEETVGINVYRVKVIQLKEWDSDPFFNTVEEKRAKGEVLTKSDLVPLLLTPLMSGSLQMKERILKGLKILHTADESITRLEAKNI